jgi:hypothetical protein
MIQAPGLHGGQINVRYRNGSVAVSALSAAMAPPTGEPVPAGKAGYGADYW